MHEAATLDRHAAPRSPGESLHVCILACQHAAGDPRVAHRLARSFVAAGFRVSWVGPDLGAKAYEPGVEFHLFPARHTRLDRLARRRLVAQAARALGHVDLYFAVEPDSAAAAIALARRTGGRVVFDIHEFYHREMLLRWVPRWLLPAVGAVVRSWIRSLCRRSALVVGVSDEILEAYHTDGRRELVVRNCASLAMANGPAADVCGAGRPAFTVMHGKSTAGHGTARLIEALGILKARGETGFRAVCFEYFDGPEGVDRQRFMALVEQHDVADSIDLRPLMPHAEMASLLARCDAGLLAYDRDWGTFGLPNRLFEYMAAGLPIIAPTYAAAMRHVVDAERCGVVVDCENPQALADVLSGLRGNPALARELGERAREAFLGRHNWELECEPLITAMRGLMPACRPLRQMVKE